MSHNSKKKFLSINIRQGVEDRISLEDVSMSSVKVFFKVDSTN